MSGNLLEKEWRELNAGQSVLEWKVFTLKWVWKLIFTLKRVEHCHQKSPFTPFRVCFHSKTHCPALNSYKEWKSILLHLESALELILVPKNSKFSDHLSWNYYKIKIVPSLLQVKTYKGLWPMKVGWLATRTSYITAPPTKLSIKISQL